MPPFPSSSRLDETSKVRLNRDVSRPETSNRNIAVPVGGAGGAIAPPSFGDLGKIKIFRAVRRKYLGKTIVFRAAI